MGVQLSDIHSLSEFQRNTREHIRRLKKSGKPAVLTVNGQAEIVVQSAAAYQKLLDDQEWLESIRGISRGLEQAKRSEGRPMRDFIEALAKEQLTREEINRIDLVEARATLKEARAIGTIPLEKVKKRFNA